VSQTDLYSQDLAADLVSSEFTDGIGQGQDNFDWWNDVNFPNLWDTIGNETFEELNLFPPGLLNFLGQSLQEPATNLVDGVSQPTAPT
jgi:hypothetical protein